MGRVKTFAILYDRPTYSCGQWVTGRIVLELTNRTEVKALQIHAKGKAYVHKEESDPSSESHPTWESINELRYFKHKHLLIGTESSEEITVLQAGRHEYPFGLVLPTTPPLPSSFKGVYGYVSYWITAKLHRPWKLRTKVKEDFTVFNHIDSNAPELLEPVIATDEKTICCWCCASGPVLLNAKIERKGFIAGESIQVSAEIENYSSRNVVPKAAIYKRITYHATSKKRSCEELITKIKGEPVLAGQKDSRNVMLLKIPEIPPTLMHCTIIQMEYTVKVSVEIPRAMDLSVIFPIVIGTTPLQPYGAPASDFGIQYGMDYGNANQMLPDKPEMAAGFLVNYKDFSCYK